MTTRAATTPLVSDTSRSYCRDAAATDDDDRLRALLSSCAAAVVMLTAVDCAALHCAVWGEDQNHTYDFNASVDFTLNCMVDSDCPPGSYCECRGTLPPVVGRRVVIIIVTRCTMARC
jgi:hypothetical protein